MSTSLRRPIPTLTGDVIGRPTEYVELDALDDLRRVVSAAGFARLSDWIASGHPENLWNDFLFDSDWDIYEANQARPVEGVAR